MLKRLYSLLINFSFYRDGLVEKLVYEGYLVRREGIGELSKEINKNETFFKNFLLKMVCEELNEKTILENIEYYKFSLVSKVISILFLFLIIIFTTFALLPNQSLLISEVISLLYFVYFMINFRIEIKILETSYISILRKEHPKLMKQKIDLILGKEIEGFNDV